MGVSDVLHDDPRVLSALQQQRNEGAPQRMQRDGGVDRRLAPAGEVVVCQLDGRSEDAAANVVALLAAAPLGAEHVIVGRGGPRAGAVDGQLVAQDAADVDLAHAGRRLGISYVNAPGG